MKQSIVTLFMVSVYSLDNPDNPPELDEDNNFSKSNRFGTVQVHFHIEFLAGICARAHTIELIE